MNASADRAHRTSPLESALRRSLPRLLAAAAPVLLAGGVGAHEHSDDLSDDFQGPPGFTLSLWAESPQLYNPTAMAVDARGRVWVTEAVNYRRWDGRNPGREHPAGDRVVILEDTDGDGRCDRSRVFVQEPELTAPLGICVLDGGRVLVSCSPNLFVYHDEDGDDVPERRETLLGGFGGFDHDHGLHSAVLAPDGRLVLCAGNAGPHVVTDRDGWTLRSGSLYAGGGPLPVDNRPGLVSDDGRVWTGGLVLGLRPDGGGLRVLAHNFRNNYEVAVDSYGDLFQSDNDDDGNACCRFLWCLPGGNHGYFSADGSRSWSFDRRAGQSTQAAHWHQDDPGVVPAGTVTGAGGPTGVCVVEVPGSPLSGRVLAADAGAGVVYRFRPELRGGGIALVEEAPLLAPRDAAADERARWFRPSDVAPGPAGEVYVADWYDPGVGGHLAGDREAYGRILCLRPDAARRPPARVEDPLQAALQDLLAPSAERRERGSAALVAAGERAVPVLATLESAPERWCWARALWVLARCGDAGRARVRAALESQEPRLAVTALRALLAADAQAPLPVALLERLAGSPHAALRREVALALREVPWEAARPALLGLAERLDDDRWSLEALGLAAEGKEEALFGELAALHGDVPARWSQRFERIAWRLHPRAAVPAVAARAADEGLSPEARRRALDALAFVPAAGAREAGEAMLSLALGGPADVRAPAREWLEQRATNEWRAFRWTDELPPAGLEAAELVWSSGTLRAGTLEVDVAMEGARRLWLVATDAGDGNGCDWADWLEPRLVVGGRTLALAQVPWVEAEAQWGEVRVGRNAEGGPLRVDGHAIAEGIGTHAFSRIAFDLPEESERFRARVAPDDGGTSQPGARTSIEFRVYLERAPDPARLAALRARALEPGGASGEREAALRELAADAEGGMLLVHLAAKGLLDAEARAVASEAIFHNPDLAVRALASEHFARPREPERPGGPLPPVSELARIQGDRVRGRALFFGERAACSSCHALTRGGFVRGGAVGPELTRIREKLGREGLLDAILNPSAGIALGYETWVVEDARGRITSGFLLADGADLVLRDTRGVRHVIPADEVVDRYRQTLSTMPEGVALALEASELVDLVAFLEEDPERTPLLGAPIELFDGRSLDGWTAHLAEPGVPLEDVWTVQDGVLACEGEPLGYLRTERDFTSYVLEVEWRFDPERGAGNSGVLLRVVGEDMVWPRSIEAQLLDRQAGTIWNIGGFDMQTDPARTSGRRTARAELCSERPLGEWNRYRITLDRGRLTLEVNGVLQNAAAWCEEVAGKIALQSEGAPIQFRRVRLTPIIN